MLGADLVPGREARRSGIPGEDEFVGTYLEEVVALGRSTRRSRRGSLRGRLPQS
jgi:hypothetical protein